MNSYLSPEDLIIARENGINERTAIARVYEYGWDSKKAITKPVQKHFKNRDKWIKIAKRHGVGSWTFKRRVYAGMSLTLAASYPPLKKGKKSKFSQRTIDKAKANGIGRTTFLKRVNKCGWSIKDAISIPIMSHEEMGKISRKRDEII